MDWRCCPCFFVSCRLLWSLARISLSLGLVRVLMISCARVLCARPDLPAVDCAPASSAGSSDGFFVWSRFDFVQSLFCRIHGFSSLFDWLKKNSFFSHLQCSLSFHITTLQGAGETILAWYRTRLLVVLSSTPFSFFFCQGLIPTFINPRHRGYIVTFTHHSLLFSNGFDLLHFKAAPDC
jgi:hypothetical protein